MKTQITKQDLIRFKITVSGAKALNIDPEDLKGITEIVPNQKYRIVISHGFKKDGSRNRITDTFNGTLIQAIEKKKQMIKQLDKKDIKPLGTAPFEEVAQAWCNYLEEKVQNGQLELTTYEGYYDILHKRVLPFFGKMITSEITERDIETWLAELRKQKTKNLKRKGESLHPTTVAHAFKVLMNMFNYMKLERILRENPCEFVKKKPTMQPDKRDYFSETEMDYVKELLVNENIRLKTAMFLVMDVGCRREEIIGLKWKDVNLEDRKIFIHEAVTTNANNTPISKGRIVKKGVKSIHSKRLVGITDVCAKLLCQYKNFKKDSGQRVSENDYVFTNWDNNTVWDPDRFTAEWGRFRKKHNIQKDVPIHGIRHSNATFLLSIGVPEKDVAARLGHTTEVLARTYTHSNEEDDQKIVQKLETEFYGKKKQEYSTDSVISLILGDINNKHKETNLKLMDYLVGSKVQENEVSQYIDSCREYLLEQFPKLEMFNDRTLLNDRSILQMKSSICKELLGDSLNVISDPDKIKPISLNL